MSQSVSMPSSERLSICNLISENERLEPGKDVVAGLSAGQKSLPPKYLYDPKGSELFEQICELPEYYPTRTETAILEAYAGAIAQKTGPCEIVELGSGSSTKSRILLDAYQDADYPLRYLPVDVSDTMLIESAQKLLREYAAMSICAIASTYEPALKALPPKQLPARMIAFIGSTIGNLQPDECEAFLEKISETLDVGDYFLLGLDLQKETSILEAAYNDAQGVTAAFNLNLLRHLNRQFEGNFNPDNFAHVALYNSQKNQIEMYLESLVAQMVKLKALDFWVGFEKSDRILSEISRKFDLGQMAQILSKHKLNVIEPYTDEKAWFGLLLCQKAG
ncbi:MAG: L-histidine N(alpha)-methyltransferase [Phormidesmis sp.]